MVELAQFSWDLAKLEARVEVSQEQHVDQVLKDQRRGGD